MTGDTKLWLPPMVTLLGTLIVVRFTAWLNTRLVDILPIENKVDHYAETQASHSAESRRLNGRG